MRYYPEPYSHSKDKVVLHLSYIAPNKELKGATCADTSKLLKVILII